MNDSQTVVRVIGDGQDAEKTWQRVANGLPQSTLAHAPEWRTVIRKAYGHEPLYLVAEDEEGRGGVLPAYLVRRPVIGSVAASMPFLDAGGPSAASAQLAHALVTRLVEEASRRNASAVDIRCTERLSVENTPLTHKVNMSLALPSDPDRLWRQFDGSVRNQIRKAERSGLSVECGGAEKLDDFHSIFAARMHDLGSPVHSKRFFQAILDGFGSQARVALVRKDATPIGGLVALARNGVVTVPWASCLPQYFSLCSNMLLYWETIRAACLEGQGRFDFGRSTRDSGTYRFKRQWGALESPLYWYSISMAAGADRPPHRSAAAAYLDRYAARCVNSVLDATRVAVLGARSAPRDAGNQPGAASGFQWSTWLVGLWKRLPLSVTRRLGPHVRRYLIQ
jgi:FemAB-related protein (PEP-CTERM system-associated)